MTLVTTMTTTTFRLRRRAAGGGVATSFAGPRACSLLSRCRSSLLYLAVLDSKLTETLFTRAHLPYAHDNSSLCTYFVVLPSYVSSKLVSAGIAFDEMSLRSSDGDRLSAVMSVTGRLLHVEAIPSLVTRAELRAGHTVIGLDLGERTIGGCGSKARRACAPALAEFPGSAAFCSALLCEAAAAAIAEFPASSLFCSALLCSALFCD